MSTVHEIEAAVGKLSSEELLSFRDWFSTFDAAAWDKRFEEDVAAGHLDALADEGSVAANPAFARRLRFTRPVGRVAELGSLICSFTMMTDHEAIAAGMLDQVEGFFDDSSSQHR